MRQSDNVNAATVLPCADCIDAGDFLAEYGAGTYVAYAEEDGLVFKKDDPIYALRTGWIEEGVPEWARGEVTA